VIKSLVSDQKLTVPVIFSISAETIRVEPASLTFVEPRRGVSPASQTVRITAASPGVFTVGDRPSWIRVSPDRGSTPATINVWAEVAMLPPGTSSGNIRIIGPSGEANLPVTLMLASPPALRTTPESITFNYQLGGPAPAAQTIAISSTDEEVSFTAAVATDTGTAWLRVTPVGGLTPAAVSASIDTAMLTPGRHTGTITITGAADATSVRIPVVLTVSGSPLVIERLIHAATLTPTAVVPGQMITITGMGLGPTVGISARPTAAGAIETRLGDVRVLFDGVPAPLLFVSSHQINAIVPYSVYGRLSVRVQIESTAGFSVPIEAKVQDANPGIFTVSGSGRGQAAALNEDLSSNSSSNPAPRGTVITIFGSGEGQTDPQGQDGRIIYTDLRRPRLPVAARIGGRPADVIYVGSASALVSGVFQTNLRVPEDVDPGVVPVELRVGEAVTQSGVTIVVR
jgi:uncharacterized protein (TIGR03437 family)